MSDLHQATHYLAHLLESTTSEPERQVTWLVALSGGCDSSVVLHLCTTLASHNPHLHIITAHVHHHMRASADEDASFCKKLASSSALIKAHYTLHLEHLPHKNQESAREARYKKLCAIAAQHHVDAILTGHHLDDALETMLMHAARGSGAHGLSSLYNHQVTPPYAPDDWPQTRKLHRPLIEHERAEIEEFAHAHHITWIEDPTNATDKYTRNTIRHHLIPDLKQIHGNGARGWQRTLDILRQEATFLHDIQQKLWHKVAMADTPIQGAVSLCKTSLRENHNYLIRKTFLHAHAYTAPHSRSPSLIQLDALELALEEEHATFTTQVLPGCRVEFEHERIVVLPTPIRGARGWFDEHPEEVELALPQAGETLHMHWFAHMIHWRRISESELKSTHPDAHTYYICVDTHQDASLYIRGVRPGDQVRTCSPGQEKPHSKRLKELLRAHQVPPWRRHLWPCIVKRKDGHDEEHIIASAGIEHIHVSSQRLPTSNLWIELVFDSIWSSPTRKVPTLEL